MAFRRLIMGFNHAYAANADIDRMYALLGGASANGGTGGWLRLAPEGSGAVNSQLSGEINYAHGKGMKVVVCALSAYNGSNGSLSHSYSTSVMPDSAWSSYWGGILPMRPDAVECWNEPNNNPFAGNAPDPARMAHLAVLLRGYVNTFNANNGTSIQVLSPGVCPLGPNTVSPGMWWFFDQMDQADSGFINSFDVISGHPYKWFNDATGGSTDITFDPHWAMDQMDARVFSKRGVHLPRAWSEYGAPATGSAGNYTATEATQNTHYVTDYTYLQNSINAGAAYYMLIAHKDVYDSSDGALDMGLVRGDGSWRPAANTVNQQAGISDGGTGGLTWIMAFSTIDGVAPTAASGGQVNVGGSEATLRGDVTVVVSVGASDGSPLTVKCTTYPLDPATTGITLNSTGGSGYAGTFDTRQLTNASNAFVVQAWTSPANIASPTITVNFLVGNQKPRGAEVTQLNAGPLGSRSTFDVSQP